MGDTPLKKTLLLAAVAASFATAALAQAPAATSPPPRPTEPPSNMATGVDMKRFIGDADVGTPKIFLDVGIKRTILEAGDPLQPGRNGAVMRHYKEVALATVQPGETTSLGKSADSQMVFYIEEGTARLDDGKSFWDIKPGVMMLAPPNVGYRFHVTSDKPLKMLTVEIPVEPQVPPKTEMIVRDLEKMAMTERNVHWNNFAKYVLVGERDGLFPGDRVYIVYMAPMSIAGPHAHSVEQDEVWIKASPGKSLMQVGSEIRWWKQNEGIMAPPNGQTVHAAYNLDDHMEAWLYVARLNPDPDQLAKRQAQAPNPNRPAPPAAIAEGLAASNIAPTPLPTVKSAPAKR
jgi:mannose-6-phosphate isomerase-like protein (cupin superfamily)